MVLIARPDTLAPLGACLALRDADLLRTVQWGAERIHQGGRGAATLYCKRPSSLPPRALQLIHSHSHKERQTGLGAGVEGSRGARFQFHTQGKERTKSETSAKVTQPAGGWLAVASW